MKMHFGKTKSINKNNSVSNSVKIPFLYKHTRNPMLTEPLNKRLQSRFSNCIDVFC